MSSSTQMTQEHFLAGLKHCVELASDSPDAEASIETRIIALRLLLFTGICACRLFRTSTKQYEASTRHFWRRVTNSHVYQ